MIEKKRVLVTGVFDICHVGHIRLLKAAATYGRVWVGLNDDKSVRELKGPTRPVNNELDRVEFISSFAVVFNAFLIHSTNVVDAIRTFRPDYWVKGGSYTLETLNKLEVDAANEVFAKIVIVPMHGGYSTTETLLKLEIKDEHRTVL